MDDFNTFDMFCDGSDLQIVEADDYWDKLLVDDWIYASVCCRDCMMQQTYATTIEAKVLWKEHDPLMDPTC
jgi:hypothetical protein